VSCHGTRNEMWRSGYLIEATQPAMNARGT
jgi:hypothetical protein